MKTLKDFQKAVAVKYGLGESLVMGHRKTYFDEATFEYTKYHVEKALEEAKNSVTFTEKSLNLQQEGSIMKIDEESILNAYSLDNIQ